MNGDLKNESGSLSGIISKENQNNQFTVKFEGSKITIKVNSFEIQSELLIKTKSYLKTLLERDLKEIIDQIAEQYDFRHKKDKDSDFTKLSCESEIFKSKNDAIKCEANGASFLKISSVKVPTYPFLLVPTSSMFFFEAKVLSFINDVEKISKASEFDV